MRRKNLIVKRKVDKKGSTIKNLKINKFYTKFKSIVSTKIKKDIFRIINP